MTDRTTRPHLWPVEEPGVPVLASVWPTGTDRLDAQLADRGYHPATGTDPALMTPAIAEHAITTLTRPGDIVLDPDCGSGTTIVEALRTGRHAIGLTAAPRRWRLARANVTATKARGAFADGMVLVLHRHRGTIAAAETAGLTGRIDLLLTTLRPANPTTDPAAALARLRALLAECRPLLRPGGYVVLTVAPQRHPTRHDLLDLPSGILALGSSVRLAPIARCLALTASVQGRRVHPRATLAQRRAAACISRATGVPITLAGHHTVLVFRADPDTADPALAQPIPRLPAGPRRRQRASSPRRAAAA